MLLRSVGLKALSRQIEVDLELARAAERELARMSGIEIVCPTELSVVAFRHRLREGESEEGRCARDVALMEHTLAEGEVMVSSTQLRGCTALRLVVQNHRTTAAELRRSLDAIQRGVEAVASS